MLFIGLFFLLFIIIYPIFYIETTRKIMKSAFPSLFPVSFISYNYLLKLSTQFRAYPFEMALFSALNQILLINSFWFQHWQAAKVIDRYFWKKFRWSSRQNYHEALPFLSHCDRWQPSLLRHHLSTEDPDSAQQGIVCIGLSDLLPYLHYLLEKSLNGFPCTISNSPWGKASVWYWK